MQHFPMGPLHYGAPPGFPMPPQVFFSLYKYLCKMMVPPTNFVPQPMQQIMQQPLASQPSPTPNGTNHQLLDMDVDSLLSSAQQHVASRISLMYLL